MKDAALRLDLEAQFFTTYWRTQPPALRFTFRIFKSAVTQSYWFSRRRRGRVISRHNFCEWYMKDGVFPYSFISLILIQDVEGAKWVLIHFKFNYVLYNYITPGAFPARYKTKLNGYKYTSRTKRTKTNIILKTNTHDVKFFDVFYF